MIAVEDGPWMAAVAIYGKGGIEGGGFPIGDHVETLGYSVHALHASPFEFTGPATLGPVIAKGRPASVVTSVGRVRIRPLAPSDAQALPVDPALGHNSEMLESVIAYLNEVEISADEPYDPAQEDRIESLELLLASSTGRAFALRWSIPDHTAHEVVRWYRAYGGWQSDPPSRDPRWPFNGGPEDFDWEDDTSKVQIWLVHRTAMATIMEAFDAGHPIGEVSAGLAAWNQVDDCIHAGHLKRGIARELADEWLASGGATDDVLVIFGQGMAEIPVDMVLQASLDRDKRLLPGPMGTSRRGSHTDSAWKTLVHLAITAGIDHVAHDGCSDRNCRRYHYALDLMHSKDDEGAAGRITGRDHDGVLVLVHDVVRCLPIVTPFERDDEEFPATYAALASAWRESVTEAAHAWHETLISCAAAAFEARFPWAGALDLEAALSGADLEFIPPDRDDW